MLPEVVLLSETDDPVVRDPDIVFPKLLCLVIALKNSYPESVCRNFENLCKKFPSPLNSLRLEIIAEREVAEHFKICTVASGLSDALDVGSSYALLACCYSLIRRHSLSEEKLLERSHSRIDEEETLIPLRNERCARHSCVILALEEREILFTKVI